MDFAATLRVARRRCGLSQAALAARAGTSQATVSAYESARKRPSLDTLERLLTAAGARLAVEELPGRRPTEAEHAHAARTLAAVLALAEALPVRHSPRLRYPRLPARPA